MAAETYQSSVCNYAVFRYVVNTERQTSVPVGVAIWVPDEPRAFIRLLHEDETVRGASNTQARAFIDATRRQVTGWIRSGELPYQSANVRAYSTQWWELMRGLLAFRVELAGPQPIDCMLPGEETEALYEAVVGAQAGTPRSIRVDIAMRRALGSAADDYKPNATVDGYAGRDVPVMRLCRTAIHTVVADAVNLALPDDAERDADALASKMQRIRAADPDIQLLIGYIASPGGLNGEAALKEWIEEKTATHLWDLVREREQYGQQAAKYVEGPEQARLAFAENV